MNKFEEVYLEQVIKILKKYQLEKESEGFVPTVSMMIEDLEHEVEKANIRNDANAMTQHND